MTSKRAGANSRGVIAGRAASSQERQLVVYHAAGDTRSAHDRATCEAIARILANLKGLRFAGEYDATARFAMPPYFVPTDTLVGVGHARALGIASEDDLFGGVVPFPFVATKSISHALVDSDAAAPQGWSEAFTNAVARVVLRGYTAFDAGDALKAGLALLQDGPVRIKRALGVGGAGQQVVRERKALEDVLAAIDVGEVSCYGIVLEEDLADVTTYSVGRARVDDLVVTYCGTQRTTRNPRGHDVYGGSDLLVTRGEFDALAGIELSADAREAVSQARTYDEAALHCFPGFLASRRNYDVARGIDARGSTRSGVLEQSWRVGGASGAEVAALGAFRDDAALWVVRASSTEVYGDATLPSDALVYYEGDDGEGGMLTKYARVTRVE